MQINNYGSLNLKKSVLIVLNFHFECFCVCFLYIRNDGCEKLQAVSVGADTRADDGYKDVDFHGL